MIMGWHWGQFQAICIVASIFVATVAAKSAVQGNGMSLARRRLEDGEDYYEYDISEFSLRFDKCQYVKMYDDEMAEDEDSDTPLAVKHFVAFRLCPSDSCDSCSTTFGRYVMELEEYLEATVEEQEKAFENMCDNCQEKCNDNGGYCSGCGKICYQYENLEDNGYIDASEFIQCQQLDMDNADGNNGDDDFQLYIGPRCSRDGSKILIGLFSDEDCLDPYTEADPEDYLGVQLSYHLLSHTYSNDGTTCLSCKEDNEDGEEDEEDEEDLDDVNEMCEEVYTQSAKCESKNGLTGGFIQMKREDDEYENQVENEFMACNFIDSLLWNSYTETGEIDVDGEQDVVIRSMTHLQKVSMSLLTLSIIGLLAGSYYLQKKIDNAQPKVDLACQSDAQIS